MSECGRHGVSECERHGVSECEGRGVSECEGHGVSEISEIFSSLGKGVCYFNILARFEKFS